MIVDQFMERIKVHRDNMRISNQRIIANFKAELRRLPSPSDSSKLLKEPSLSTCADTFSKPSRPDVLETGVPPTTEHNCTFEQAIKEEKSVDIDSEELRQKQQAFISPLGNWTTT